jgi:membrane associated rhomboid family serine protease
MADMPPSIIDRKQRSNLGAFGFPVALVAIMAVIHLLGVLGLGGSPEAWGNLPRHTDQLWGILTSHLRHSSWAHWLANALPLVILSGMAGTLMPKPAARAWIVIPVVSGVLLWIWGRSAAHIGASALVYGWFFFLVGMGAMRRSLAALLGMGVSLMMFSGLLWVFRAPAGVSWEGHVAGAVAGLLAAWWNRAHDKRPS